MKITFDCWAFRDLQKACTPALATQITDESKASLTRICLTFYNGGGNNNFCRAFASNGYQVTRIDVPCETSEYPDETEQVLMEPVKIPAKTEKVILDTDHKDKLYLTFIDKAGKESKADQPKMRPETPIDFAKACKKFSDQINQYNMGTGEFYIAVNPRYLINALTAMQNAESVIINFGNQVQPFMIRPRDDNQDTMAFVFPVRIL